MIALLLAAYTQPDFALLSPQEKRHFIEVIDRLDSESQSKVCSLLPGGLFTDEIEVMLEAVYGRGFEVCSRQTHSPGELLDLLCDQGLYAIFALRWGDASHALNLLRVDRDNGWVYYRNPHGRNFDNQTGDLLFEPKRIIVDPRRGIEKISIDEFRDKVTLVLVPN
ncbi:MAG: hypothetical protein J5J00_02770 [Deltaproteobacteria bacterium]|nr:hypothetical protein [Deltaproteobacteria bacterium]